MIVCLQNQLRQKCFLQRRQFVSYSRDAFKLCAANTSDFVFGSIASKLCFVITSNCISVEVALEVFFVNT